MRSSFVCPLLLSNLVLAIPPVAHSELVGRSLQWGSEFNAAPGSLEIRGVYGGRKKRYILEARKKQCCGNKKCRGVLGEILDDDCKCKKCSSGVPALDGLTCQDECPDGQENNGQGGCCPIGQKPKASGDGCEDDPDRDRKGKCPGDTVLDPNDGPQDPNVENPKCAIDDEKDCPKPNMTATRPDGAENDSTFKPKCGKLDENNRAKCNEKTQFVFVEVDADGNAIETCKQSRQYQDRKRNKPQQLKSKLKDKWNADKPNRDKKEQERKDKLAELQKHKDELEEERKKQQAISEANEKKETRMGKCSTVIALIVGVNQNDHIDQKRDDSTEDHPYDWTTQYFDEDFVHDDERLDSWPSDVNVDDIAFPTDVGPDTEQWMKYWESFASTYADELNSCSNAKRSLDRRCMQRRSVNNNFTQIVQHSTPNRAQNSASRSQQRKSTSGIMISSSTDLVVYDQHLEKRFLQIFIEIALFATRLGMSLMARTVATIARWAPRLAELAEDQSKLFQIAKPGQGAAKSVDAMKSAFSRIVQNPEFKQCVKEGVPDVLMSY